MQRKIGLQAEFTRTLLPKYVHLEGAASKAKGLVSIDWTSLVVPKVTELKGIDASTAYGLRTKCSYRYLSLFDL